MYATLVFASSAVAIAGAILACVAAKRSPVAMRVGDVMLCLGIAGVVIAVIAYVIIPDIVALFR